MKTDRELLELAARAACVNLDLTIRPDGKAFYHSDRNAFAVADGGWFSPLTDDGDALRLAVKLELNVLPGLARAPDGALTLDAAENIYAATRRAIVRAAAAIGEAME